LKEAKGIMGPYLPDHIPPKKAVSGVDKPKDNTPFRTSDGLTLELAPMDDDKPAGH
jgi:hypothetical protein